MATEVTSTSSVAVLEPGRTRGTGLTYEKRTAGTVTAPPENPEGESKGK